MNKRKVVHVERKLTAEERAPMAEIRAGAERDFPPLRKPKPAAPGLPAAIRAARHARKMTWYALAKEAGIPNQGTVRDIEQGKDVKLSNLQAVVEALGMKLELVEA